VTDADRDSAQVTDAGPQSGSEPDVQDVETGAVEVEADLDALLADVKRERDEYLDLAQRTRADFENYKKRMAKASVDAERRGAARLVRELIPIADNLERALESEGDGVLADGVRLVLRELQGIFARAGVESFDPAGERFDPSFHEALSTRPEDGTEAGIVVEVMDKGYRLDEQVLRPARVVVSA
jgi:molecular chaperone GrpE